MNADRYHPSEYIWFLQLRNKGLERKLETFRSGSAYTNLRKEYESVIRKKDTEINKLKKNLAASHSQNVTNREHWFEVTQDLEKEHAKALKRKDREIAALKKRVLEVERQKDQAKETLKEYREKYYQAGSELEEARGLIQKLTAQVNKDFQNSSIPSSSQGPGRKKIPNGRQKTGRKPGGQPGHKGHRITRQTPTETTHLPEPEEFANHPDYYPTGDIKKRQKIILKISVEISEMAATIYRNRKTGSRVHADFPEGYDTDVTYDSSVKAFAFLLANEGNMSAGKIRSILREVSHGKLNLSVATINGFCKEFSEKSASEKQEIINSLMTSPVMNVDFTNSNVNGKSKQVLILASPGTGAALFVARDHKGHQGILGTPLEHYVGTLVHDHDTTFYRYGLQHQECMHHNIRYTIGSEQNETERKWNQQMHQLLQEMIHYRNHLSGDFDADKVKELEDRYDQILELAKKEYEEDPPSDYYREGFNLYRRLVEYRESELLFLHDKSVPSNNSLAERLARVFKRKQKQMMVIRSDKNYECLCDSLSVITTFRGQNDSSLYEKTCEIFSRRKARKPRKIPGVTAKADVNN